jgi:hypothetical protein
MQSQQLQQAIHALLDTQFTGIKPQIGAFWCFVRRVYAGEVGQVTAARLLV